MTRSLSSAMQGAIHAQETGECFLWLLTVSHPSLVTPLRYTNDSNDVVSNGDTYTAHPFEIVLADERDDAPPEIQLVIDNVTREPLATLRGLATPPTVVIQIVLASAPNVIEIGPVTCLLRGVNYDAFAVRGALTFEPVLSEPYPGRIFDPVSFPALF